MNARQRETETEKPPTLFERIEEAVALAQDLAMPPTPAAQAERLRDELVPALLEARLYVEVGRLRRTEVRSGLSRALRSAYRLADADRKYVGLVNRLRVLVEDADIAARER